MNDLLLTWTFPSRWTLFSVFKEESSVSGYFGGLIWEDAFNLRDCMYRRSRGGRDCTHHVANGHNFKNSYNNVKREKKENLYIQNVSCLIWQTLFLQYEIFICSTTRINVHELWLSTVNAAPGWFCEKILRKKQTDGSFRFLFFVPQQKQNW